MFEPLSWWVLVVGIPGGMLWGLPAGLAWFEFIYGEQLLKASWRKP